MSVPLADLPNQAPPASLRELREALAFVTRQYDRLADGTTDVLSWLWDAIQGDFNLERSGGQIAFDAAIGMIPVVDQICDVRDLIANCRYINEDRNDTWAWVALACTLIGLFPTLGSLVKGVLKIFFLFVRRSGGRQVAGAVNEAMTWVITFLRKREVHRYWRHLRIDNIFAELARLIRAVRSQVNLPRLLQAFDRGISLVQALVAKLRRVPVVGRRAQQALEMVVDVRRVANEHLRRALRPVQDVLDTIVRRLELEDIRHRGAVVNTRNIHFRGMLPETQAVALMRTAEPKPVWLKKGEVKYPALNPIDEIEDVQKAARRGTHPSSLSDETIGFPMLTEEDIASFNTLRKDVIKGPAKLYRVVSPGNGAASNDWVSEEVFHQLMSAADPKATWRGGLAVWPQWNPNGQFVVYEVRAGESLKVWRGRAASQELQREMPGYYLEGGLEQIKFTPAEIAGDPVHADMFGRYRRDPATGALTRTELDGPAFARLSDEEQAQHMMLRERIRHPNITGPYQTDWGYTDFDAQLGNVTLGLPMLPGQITNGAPH